MANDLRLSAVVDDKFSAPLKKLQDQLKQVGDRQHVQRFKDQETAFRHTNESVSKLVDTMKGGLEPIMSKVGLAGIGMTGALGAIVTGAQEAGDKLANLGRMSATIGLKPQQILNDQALLAKYGIAADQANADLKALSKNMYELEKRQGGLYTALVTEGGKIGQAEAERLRALKGNLQAQLEEYLKWLNKMQNVRLAAHYAEAAGDADLGIVATVSPATLQKQIDESRKQSEKANADEIARGQAHQEAMNRLKQRIGTNWNKISSVVNPVIDWLLPNDDQSMKKGAEKGAASTIAHVGGFVQTDWVAKAEAAAAAAAHWYKLNAYDTAPLGPANRLTRDGLPYLQNQNLQGIGAESGVSAAAPGVTAAKPEEGLFQKLLNHLEKFKWIEPAEGAEMRKPISLLRADDDDIGNRPNAVGAARSLELSDDTKEKVTGIQKAINSDAMLGSLKDISLDAERRIAEWWKKGIIKGMDDLASQSPNASADGNTAGADAEALYNPSGANASRKFRNPAVGPYSPGPKGTAAQAEAMKAAMDQLGKEGVPEEHRRAAAALLTGQASMESGIDPNKSHDGGTGYGIYGARLERRDRMLAWMKANNYPANSLEGQMRYMAHEAMTDPTYGASRTTLMGASRDTLARDSGILTRNFERPAVANDRSGATMSAFGALDPTASASALPSGHGLTNDYGNLHLYASEAVAGGPAEAGLIALAHHVQDSEGGAANATFHALRDKFHVFENPNSAHNKGRAFDVSFNTGDYEGARQRLRAYLVGKGMTEGDMSGRSGDFAIEPGTPDHMHAQFNSEAAAEKYLAMVAPAATGAYAIGDSIAARVQMATGMAGMGVVGASPAEILKRINALPNGSLAGKQVLLSGGASNNIGQAGLTEQEIAAITAKGAKAADIMLLGVGDRADFQAAKVNDRLRKIAKDTGVAFEAIGATADRVHPTIARAKAIADDLKTPHIDKVLGAQTSMAPGGGAGANGRMDVHFHNVPSNMRTTTRIAGDVFKKVHINRGPTMPSAVG